MRNDANKNKLLILKIIAKHRRALKNYTVQTKMCPKFIYAKMF